MFAQSFSKLRNDVFEELINIFWSVLLEESNHRLLRTEINNGYGLRGRKQRLDGGDCETAEILLKSQSIKLRNISGSTDFSQNFGPTTRNFRKCAIRTKRPAIHRQGTDLLTCSEGTFRVHKIFGDGNCMFRAISYILHRHEGEHQSLRSEVVQHVKENWLEYGPFVMAEWNISDKQRYCDYMSIVGTFASELECAVASKLHRMNLSIYREIPARFEVKRVFHYRLNGNYDTARLLFTGRADSGHYNVLLPAD